MKKLFTSLFVLGFIVCSIKGTWLAGRRCSDLWPNEATAISVYNNNTAPLKTLISWDYQDAVSRMNYNWVTKFYFSPFCSF